VMDHTMPGHGQMLGMMQQHQQPIMQMHGSASGQTDVLLPLRSRPSMRRSIL
jgi:hypothetical protein